MVAAEPGDGTSHIAGTGRGGAEPDETEKAGVRDLCEAMSTRGSALAERQTLELRTVATVATKHSVERTICGTCSFDWFKC